MSKRLGSEGEQYAKHWLELQDYRIVAQNWRIRTAEIDLIAEKGDTLVFIEVKTLPHTELTDLDLIINKRKQSNICKAAKHFLQEYRKYNGMYIRFDVLVLPFDPCRGNAHIEPIHLENAFEDTI